MSWLPSNLGAEPKKIAALGGLFVVLVVVYFINRTPSGAPPAPVAKTATVPSVPIPPPRATQARLATRSETQEFRPTLKRQEGVDISGIDPTLKMDLLAKVQNVPMSGGSRSLFEFGQAPAPPPPPVKPIVPGPVQPKPPPVAVEPPKPAAPPPPPPIPLKFYGYAGTTRAGARRAFFLDGEDIFVAAENELVRNRYKIIRIGVNSAVVEDTTGKNQQTLELTAEMSQ